MPRMIFVNLPVTNLDGSMAFYRALVGLVASVRLASWTVSRS